MKICSYGHSNQYRHKLLRTFTLPIQNGNWDNCKFLVAVMDTTVDINHYDNVKDQL
jgi:hypothetical protein